MDLKEYIRNVPDFPESGITYRDITPLLLHQESFRYCIEAFIEESQILHPDVIVGVESRGFIFGSAIAYAMHLPFVPIRKSGKLPHLTKEVKYELEYGSDIIQIHSDAINPYQKVVIVDDVVATGGTLKASRLLVEKVGGVIVGMNAVIVLKDLCDPEIMNEDKFFYLVEY